MNLIIFLWSTDEEYIEISNDCKTIKSNGFCEWSTCYGKNIIPSTIINKEYTWKMKISPKTSDLDIGIENAVNPHGVTTRFADRKSEAAYAYNGYIGSLWIHNNGSILKLPKYTDNNNDGVIYW